MSMLFSLFFPLVCFGDDLETAKGFFYSGQYKKAADYYVKALKDNKNNYASTAYRAGLSYFLLGNLGKAHDYFQKAKDKDPNIFGGKSFRVPGGSMSPTLIPGDQVIADNEYYENTQIKRGDVIVYLYPENKKTIHLHRIIALPGDIIESRNKKIFINGKPFHDQYVQHSDPLIEKDSPRDNFGPYLIPDDKCFVMGDNRDNSYDSRYWGYVGKDLIIGKVLVIYLSLPDEESVEGSKQERIGRIVR